ncbi:MAG: tRNA (adenosine(37)-N6)-threonylcarbamoyltransferase complex ATPase subunit type 1 TsaE [Lachnospiraceae bacterium]|nr:tRNA (adenosine(37)-N6)-threonylcarbamoyltransferase complex ATPase subunit type 1 TsaE [Lachnospiraceae bacterium]
MVYESNSPEETYEIAFKMGQEIKTGEIVCLYGDLGVGKTVFAKGFAKGLGVNDVVTSPTFTLVQEYHGKRMPLYHFDVYRIGDIEEMFEIGYEEYFYGDGVCLIEWADFIKELLPHGYTKVTISKSLSENVDYRKICIEK